jgi:hypothetical protein
VIFAIVIFAVDAEREAGKPALFHTGQTGVGSGMRLKYSNPMHVDDIAVDFPDMPIILAHPSFPWQEEALAVVQHKPNVLIELSGWSPKYFPPILVRYCNSILRNTVMFGSDWPMITPERWLGDFEKIAIKDEIRPKILKETAATLLGLAG